MGECLLLAKDEGIFTITVNRPEVRNAMNAKAWRELRVAVARAGDDSEIRVVIVTGSGDKAFVGGSDIRSLTQRTMVETLSGEVQNTLSELENLPKPVIAAVNGYALGGGCELAMACDIRVASENARFGQPEVGIGIIPGAGGSQRLPRLIGMARAKELVFTGDLIDAREAERIGLVNRVVPQAELLPAARGIARKIMAKSPLAVQVAKTVMNAGSWVDLNTALMLERLGQTVLFGSEDRGEGLSAFLEKRPPEFKGR